MDSSTQRRKKKHCKRSFVKFIPNTKAFSPISIRLWLRFYIGGAKILANLVTTKKEICIDLALNSLFNLAGLPHCGFLEHSQSLLCRLGPGLNIDNNRIGVFKTFWTEAYENFALNICQRHLFYRWIWSPSVPEPWNVSTALYFIGLEAQTERKKHEIWVFFLLEPSVIGKHIPTILIATFFIMGQSVICQVHEQRSMFAVLTGKNLSFTRMLYINQLEVYMVPKLRWNAIFLRFEGAGGRRIGFLIV